MPLNDLSPPVVPVIHPPVADRTGAPLRLDTAALFSAGREVLVAHAGGTYRLRLTRQNKLILTK